MPLDAASIVAGVTGLGALGIGVLAQIRTHRLRHQWKRVGLGLEEPRTGLATLAAVPVLFPNELALATATKTTLTLLAIRQLTAEPDEVGRAVSQTLREHEYGFRVDYDLFVVLLHTDDRDAAVQAAARIGRSVCGAGHGHDVRVGLVICPDEADDFLDAVDIATRRMRSVVLIEAVAGALKEHSMSDTPATHAA